MGLPCLCVGEKQQRIRQHGRTSKHGRRQAQMLGQKYEQVDIIAFSMFYISMILYQQLCALENSQDTINGFRQKSTDPVQLAATPAVVPTTGSRCGFTKKAPKKPQKHRW